MHGCRHGRRSGAAFAVNAASCDDRHVSAVLNIEIIVYDINAFLAHNDRDMHLLVFCLAADMDVNARLSSFFTIWI